MSGSRGNPGSTLVACCGQTPWLRLGLGPEFSSCLKLRSKFKRFIRGVLRSLLRAGHRSAMVALGVPCWGASPALLADTLITNALVIDGTGSAAAVGSVRLSGDRITAVGELTPNESDEIIDAGGLVLAPGFIDTHSHSDRLILAERDALAKITQDITSAVALREVKYSTELPI